jgi:hypothetical protein
LCSLITPLITQQVLSVEASHQFIRFLLDEEYSDADHFLGDDLGDVDGTIWKGPWERYPLRAFWSLIWTLSNLG